MATEIDDLQINISASSNNAEKSLDDLVSTLERLTSSLRQTINQSSKIGSSGGVKGNFDTLNKSIKKTTKNTFSLASAFGKFYASYFLVVRGIKGLWNSIEGTTDLIEAFNYYTVSLGKISSEWSGDWEKYGYENADAYAKSFTDRLNVSLGKLSGIQIAVGDDGKGLLSVSGTKNLGLNIKEITQYASQLASVMNSVGQTGETTIAATDAFTKLAGDISSLFNVDYSSVSANLQSGLIGQSRALYKYGIDITNATLQTYAYELGLEKTVTEMTQAEKMQLRIIAILKQSKVAWGDLANTISSPNNMIRQFKNNLNETGIVLGQLFIPLLENVLPVLNGFSIAIKNLLIDIAGLLGVELDFSEFGQGYNDTSDGLDEITDSLDDLTSSAKKAKGSLRGFDELNVITTSDASTSGLSDTIDLTNEIIAATEEYNKVWEQAYAQMENRAQEFAANIETYLEPIKGIFGSIAIGDYILVGENFSTILTGITELFADAIENVDWYAIGEDIGDFIGAIDWTTVFSNIGDIIFGAIEGALAAWQGAFDASPIETSIITAVALLTWSGLPLAIVQSMAKAFTVPNFTSAVSSVFAIGGSVPAVEVIGVEIIEIIDGFIEETFGKEVLDAMAASLFVATWAGIGAVFGGPIGALVGGLIALIIGAFSGEEYGNTTFTAIGKWFKENIVPWFTKEKWFELGVTAGTALGEKLMAFETWWNNTKLVQWWSKSVTPWFTKERWNTLANQAKEGIKSKWEEFSAWWGNNAVSKWYDEKVKPWFSEDKWSWDGIKKGLSEAFNNAIDAVKEIWNSFANWLNDKLTWTIPAVTVFGNKITDPITIDLGKVPTFMNGGYVNTAGLFMAGENGIPEMMGTIGGKAAVASGREITGISDAVYSTGQTQASLLNTAIGLLRIIAEKEFGISGNEIYKTVRQYESENYRRTGNSVFVH